MGADLHLVDQPPTTATPVILSSDRCDAYRAALYRTPDGVTLRLVGVDQISGQSPHELLRKLPSQTTVTFRQEGNSDVWGPQRKQDDRQLADELIGWALTILEDNRLEFLPGGMFDDVTRAVDHFSRLHWEVLLRRYGRRLPAEIFAGYFRWFSHLAASGQLQRQPLNYGRDWDTFRVLVEALHLE